MERDPANKRELQRRMYELDDSSRAQRATLAVVVGLWIALAVWLLVGGGIQILHDWAGWIPAAGDFLRRALLATTLVIYYVRILFTEFVFLKRGVSWAEAFTIAVWLLFIVLLLSIAGGTNTNTVGVSGIIGMGLFLFGSWINSYSEYARNEWKQLPENCGRLYTQGLFRYSRHPNYLGDLLLFSGMCLISGAWITAVVPVLMLAGFVFVNIPILDSHLHDRYGTDFDNYARRTSRLFPFVY